jgi:hypothetical protein
MVRPPRWSNHVALYFINNNFKLKLRGRYLSHLDYMVNECQFKFAFTAP